MNETERTEISTKDFDELYSIAINAALECDMAFKLLSYRISSPKDFIERMNSISMYTAEVYAKIMGNGENSMDMALKQKQNGK